MKDQGIINIFPYHDYIYQQPYQRLQTKTSLMPDFTQLYSLSSNKRLTVQHLLHLLQQLQALQQSAPLLKKSSLILTLTKCYFLVTHHYLQDLSKQRQDIFYGSLKPTHKKDTATITRKKRPKHKHQQIQVKELSIKEILQEIEEKNRHQLPIEKQMVTPVKEPIYPQNQLNMTLPPFNPELIAQISADINSQSAIELSQQKSVNLSKLEPDLKDYQNLLALTQKGISLTTAKKRNARTAFKTVFKGQQIIQDRKIEISQGNQLIRQLQLLTTKVKVTKDKEVHTTLYFCQQFSRIHPTLASTKSYVEGLRKYKRDSTNLFPGFEQSEIVSHQIFGDSNHKDQQRHNFFINEQNNPTLTMRLQELIEQKVEEELFSKETVSFNAFSYKYNAKSQIKGELFYQLLHMDFKLFQGSPEAFGDILISRAVT